VTLLLLIVGLRETIAAEFWLPGWEASDCEAEPCPPDTPHHGFPADGRTAPPIWAATWIARVTVVTAPERLFGSRPGETSLG
jgi:hypothetical protein